MRPGRPTSGRTRALVLQILQKPRAATKQAAFQRLMLRRISAPRTDPAEQGVGVGREVQLTRPPSAVGGRADQPVPHAAEVAWRCRPGDRYSAHTRDVDVDFDNLRIVEAAFEAHARAAVERDGEEGCGVLVIAEKAGVAEGGNVDVGQVSDERVIAARSLFSSAAKRNH